MGSSSLYRSVTKIRDDILSNTQSAYNVEIREITTESTSYTLHILTHNNIYLPLSIMPNIGKTKNRTPYNLLKFTMFIKKMAAKLNKHSQTTTTVATEF